MSDAAQFLGSVTDSDYRLTVNTEPHKQIIPHHRGAATVQSHQHGAQTNLNTVDKCASCAIIVWHSQLQGEKDSSFGQCWTPPIQPQRLPEREVRSCKTRVPARPEKQRFGVNAGKWCWNRVASWFIYWVFIWIKLLVVMKHQLSANQLIEVWSRSGWGVRERKIAFVMFITERFSFNCQ